MLRLIIGDDIFISYSRSDTTDYALELSKKLDSSGYACYLDQFETSPNKNLPPALLKKLLRSSMLVVLLSESAVHSDAIRREVEAFLRTGRMIIPVEMGGRIGQGWTGALAGLPIVAESRPNLDTNAPSETVIDRIHASYNYTQRRTRLRRAAAGITATVCAFLVGGSLVGRIILNEFEGRVEDLSGVITILEQESERLNATVSGTKLLARVPFRRLPNKYDAAEKEVIQEELAMAQQLLEETSHRFEVGDVAMSQLLVARRQSVLLQAELKWADGMTDEAFQLIIDWVNATAEELETVAMMQTIGDADSATVAAANHALAQARLTALTVSALLSELSEDPEALPKLKVEPKPQPVRSPNSNVPQHGRDNAHDGHRPVEGADQP